MGLPSIPFVLPMVVSGLPWQLRGLSSWLSGEESSCQCRRCGFDPWVGKIPLEKEVATHSRILTWEIPWTNELGELQSMAVQSQTRLSNSVVAGSP